MLTWHYFAIATVLTGSIASLLLRALMKNEENDPILFSIIFQFILTAVVFVYSLSRGFVFPPPLHLLPLFALSAVLYAAGSLSMFRASSYIGAGEMTILTAGGSVITILLGVFLTHNSFSLANVAGVALILASIVVLYAKEKLKMNAGVWYALVVAVTFGTAVVSDSVIIKTYSPTSFVPIMCFLPGLILLILFPRSILKVKKLLRPKPLSHIVIYSVFYAISAVTYYLALDSGATVSQLSPINRASIITTVLLASIFLNEKKDMTRKLLSAALVTAGVFLLA